MSGSLNQVPDPTVGPTRHCCQIMSSELVEWLARGRQEYFRWYARAKATWRRETVWRSLDPWLVSQPNGTLTLRGPVDRDPVEQLMP